MRIECPKCLKINTISSDLIVTHKRALQLACSLCKAEVRIEINLSDEEMPLIGRSPADNESETRLTSSVAECQETPEILSLKSKILRSLVELPPMPNIILKAREIMEDPGSSLKELAAVIEHDQAIVARVLALANSAYYGLSGLVSSIQHASILLGQKTLGELITIAASSRLLSKKLKGYQLQPGDLWKHSLAVALGSKIISGMINRDWVEDAFIAGLLHDAGKIILDPYVEERNEAFETHLQETSGKFFTAEKQILGFDHAEVMSRASRFWRYPESQSMAIRYHHYPTHSGNNRLAYIVHLADFAAKEAGFKSGESAQSSEIDPHILEYLGFENAQLKPIIAEIATSVEKLATEFQ
ncbi:MAG: HDOD domain-containing protein [Desulfobacterales bacterium]|jgi:HD-like signal output (HDOD) protein